MYCYHHHQFQCQGVHWEDVLHLHYGFAYFQDMGVYPTFGNTTLHSLNGEICETQKKKKRLLWKEPNFFTAQTFYL